MSDCHEILIRIKKNDPEAYSVEFREPVDITVVAQVIIDILTRIKEGEMMVSQDEHPGLIVTPHLGGSDDILN